LSIRVTFHGAAGAVTGSCFRLETSRARILVDCGLFQGSKTEKELNYRDFPFEPARIDALVLTHAHIDHSGLVPKLVKAGFSGRVHATEETADLASIMLPDSGAIQESEVARLNRRNAQRGRPAVTPIYGADDAARALAHFTAQDYGALVEIAPGIRLRFWNAGHLLGSASAEILIEDGGERLRRLGLADPRRALEQERLAQSEREIGGGREALGGDVLGVAQGPGQRLRTVHALDRATHRHQRARLGFAPPCARSARSTFSGVTGSSSMRTPTAS